MPRLLLVRHGQSTWNADGRWQGQADPPLTARGRHQAAAAGAAIGAVDAIVSSTLERAAVTAEIISEQVGIGPVVALPGLVERCAGEWEGLTRSQIEERYPGYLERGDRPPGWESDDALLERTMSALELVVAGVAQERGDVDLDGSDAERAGLDGAGPIDIVVVTHGGVIYQVERHLGADFERMSNLGGRWIERRIDGSWLLGDRVDLLGGVDVTIPDQI